jgi:hypothetical protein
LNHGSEWKNERLTYAELLKSQIELGSQSVYFVLADTIIIEQIGGNYVPILLAKR